IGGRIDARPPVREPFAAPCIGETLAHARRNDLPTQLVAQTDLHLVHRRAHRALAVVERLAEHRAQIVRLEAQLHAASHVQTRPRLSRTGVPTIENVSPAISTVSPAAGAATSETRTSIS